MLAATSLAPLSSPVAAATIGIVVDADQVISQPFDAFWADRLESQGHTVKPVGADVPSSDPSLDDVDVFIVSNDANSQQAASGFGFDDPRPYILYESGLYDDTGISSLGERVMGNTLQIVDPAHPLAAGLSGPVTIYTGSQQLTVTGQTLGPGTHVVATHNGRPAIAVLEAGDVDIDGLPAPGQRIALFPHDGGDGILYTGDGLALLDAAVDYALVPEPSTLGLAAIGFLFAMACFGSRKRRSS
jgi:hypothetical protein